MFAITSTMKKWHHTFLVGIFAFTMTNKVRTVLCNQTIQTPSQLKLLGFNYDILYTPRCMNFIIDALSRILEGFELLMVVVSSRQPLLIDQLQ